MIDLHTHSKYSFDTEAEPAEITDMAHRPVPPRRTG